jgi:hypothetical protein
MIFFWVLTLRTLVDMYLLLGEARFFHLQGVSLLVTVHALRSQGNNIAMSLASGDKQTLYFSPEDGERTSV